MLKHKVYKHVNTLLPELQWLRTERIGVPPLSENNHFSSQTEAGDPILMRRERAGQSGHSFLVPVPPPLTSVGKVWFAKPPCSR